MKMTFVVAALLLVAVSATFSSSTAIKLETSFEVAPCLGIFTTGDNCFGYALVSKNYAEAYAGLKYAPSPNVEVGLGAGLEQAENPFRIGGWIWLGQGDVSFCHLFEDGGSGPWHMTTVAYHATPELSLGLIDRSFYGRGITAEYQLGKEVKLTAAMYDSGRHTLALSYSF